MRLLMVSLLVLIATVAAVLFAQQDSGHIMIAYRDWTIESSLVLFVVGLLILFLALYFTLRFWNGIRSLPQNLRRWRHQRRDSKVRTSYLRGMTALTEGQWPAAEKWLVKEVQHSNSPALHYLAAAQAAEAQGSMVRRDSYLRAAAAHDAKADVAVGLAQATYYLEHHQAKEARAVLSRLHLARPKQVAVLEKLMKATIALQDWEGLLQLIPELERRKVISSSKVDEVQCQAYRDLFVQAGLQKDKERLRNLWDRAPRSVRRNEDVLFDYVRIVAGVDPDAGAQLDDLLAEAIYRRWNDALVYAYGLIPSDPGNLPGQLGRAERWLTHHSDNAVLLLTLGRLCVRNHLWGKGRTYLEASLAIEPQAETYRELGNLLEKLNNKGAALDCYRKALILVPANSFTPLGAQHPLLLPLLPAQSR
jgi:HemY protein